MLCPKCGGILYHNPNKASPKLFYECGNCDSVFVMIKDKLNDDK